jgi:hypothetical protein
MSRNDPQREKTTIRTRLRRGGWPQTAGSFNANEELLVKGSAEEMSKKKCLRPFYRRNRTIHVIAESREVAPRGVKEHYQTAGFR